MVRQQAEYSEFDHHYDVLVVDPEALGSFAHDTLSRDDVAAMLGRLTANYLHTSELLHWHPSTAALEAKQQDMYEMAGYYGGDRRVTWVEAGRIVDTWLADFND